jgi:hypothetical protein
VAFAMWMRSKMTPESFQYILRTVLIVIGGAFAMVLLLATFLQSNGIDCSHFLSMKTLS